MIPITDIRDDYRYTDRYGEGRLEVRMLAEAIADAINAGGDEHARADYDKVFVARRLSRGTQRMGWIEIDDYEGVNCHPLQRSKAGIERQVREAIC